MLTTFNHAILFILIFLMSIGFTADGQTTLDTGGGEGTGPGGVVSFSIGQIFFESSESDSIVITEGVQQPYEISGVLVEELAEAGLARFSIYPNPATSYVVLTMDASMLPGLQMELYNSQGKMVLAQNIQTCQSSISLDELAFDIYFLKLFSGEKEITFFKIIKC